MSEVTCSLCQGRGELIEIECRDCAGTGFSPEEDKPLAQCHTCFGSGVEEVDICPQCGGVGKIEEEPYTFPESQIIAKNNNKSEQSKLIGEHPDSGIFFDWFECDDTPASDEKKHRKLTNKGLANSVLVEHLSNWILKHHASVSRLNRIKRKKEILEKHKFMGYMDERMPFPVKSEKTQKGNLGEIILGEYLTASSGSELLVYKLQYNPNVEQSMKGDDILLFNKEDIQNKVIMGEAKFRATKSKQALDDIVSSLSSKNLPISLTFVCDRLEEVGEVDLADEIDKLISNLHKSKTSITYVGFYHSDINVSKTIEKNLKSDNKNLVVLSYGENNPEQLVKDSFAEALKKIMD